jgi:HlyD family secretion protein
MKKLTLTLVLLSLVLTACTGTATPAAPTAAEPTPVAETASGVATAEGKLLPAPAVKLAFAQGGVVAEVLVKPGDKVATGEVLARLVGIKSVQAQIATAQSQYDQVYSAAMAQEKPKRTQDWYKTQSKDFTLPVWYYDQQEQLRAAQVAVDKAEEALVKTQKKLADVAQTTGADFIEAETNLNTAQADYQVAKNLNDRVKNGRNLDEMTQRQLFLLTRDKRLQDKEIYNKWWVGETKISQDIREAARKIYDDARSNLQDAQDVYDDTVTTEGAQDVFEARAQVSVADERYYTAQDYVRALQTGSESQDVTAAQNAVDQAKAALDLYELRAPFGGTVLSFDLSAGEAAVPGLPIAFLADTATWTVETKDLAEIDIARVALGQSVTVKLDAFPGEEFPGKVTAIDPVGQEYLGDMTYKVTITLDKIDERFMWNMTATVNIDAK